MAYISISSLNYINLYNYLPKLAHKWLKVYISSVKRACHFDYKILKLNDIFYLKSESINGTVLALLAYNRGFKNKFRNLGIGEIYNIEKTLSRKHESTKARNR